MKLSDLINFQDTLVLDILKPSEVSSYDLDMPVDGRPLKVLVYKGLQRGWKQQILLANTCKNFLLKGFDWKPDHAIINQAFEVLDALPEWSQYIDLNDTYHAEFILDDPSLKYIYHVPNADFLGLICSYEPNFELLGGLIMYETIGRKIRGS